MEKYILIEMYLDVFRSVLYNGLRDLVTRDVLTYNLTQVFSPKMCMKSLKAKSVMHFINPMRRQPFHRNEQKL